MKDPRYAERMGTSLADLRYHLNEFIHMKGIKRVKVIQGAHLLGAADGAAGLWGDDPVHLSDTGYQHYAAGIEKVIEDVREVETLSGSTGGKVDRKEPDRKKIKFDLTKTRPDWIRKNVGEAVRREEREERRGRGGRGQYRRAYGGHQGRTSYGSGPVRGNPTGPGNPWPSTHRGRGQGSGHRGGHGGRGGRRGGRY